MRFKIKYSYEDGSSCEENYHMEDGYMQIQCDKIESMKIITVEEEALDSKRVDERVMQMAKIQDPETLFMESAKPSIMDITRMFG